MDPFATTGSPPVHTPVVGMPLTLNCMAPYSYPRGIITWALVETNGQGDKSAPYYKTTDFFRPLVTDARVAVDYNGNITNEIYCFYFNSACYMLSVCVVF